MNPSALAAHRFGFSETSLAPLRSDPRAWVRAQFDAPAPLDQTGLLGTAEIAPLTRRVLQNALTQQAANAMAPGAVVGTGAGAAMAAAGESMAPMSPAAAAADRAARRAARPPAPGASGASAAPGAPAVPGAAPAPTDRLAADDPRAALRRATLESWQRRWQQVVTTPTPVVERWVRFWGNHFCVAATKGATAGLVGPHECEAIRPHATGSFRALLQAATLHPGMLLYLDNAQSIGPNSRAGRRRDRGLNENLARELLELHTVGVHGGYTQADVTELARLLTGWTVRRDGTYTAEFNPALHEPGPKTVMGRRYPEGPEAVERLFDDLARHPATARFVSTKLVRHFVSDEPPAALVDTLAARFTATDGDLRAVADALFASPIAWAADRPPKFKRPEELVLSAHRLLKLPVQRVPRLVATMTEMGQPPGRAPSPQGWPDLRDDWMAPDALWKRVQWAASMAEDHASLADARQLAALAFGDDLSADTRQQIDRAESPRQALALLLASPDFQRR